MRFKFTPKDVNSTVELGAIQNCGNPSTDLAKNLVLTMIPTTPVAGQNLYLEFGFDLDAGVRVSALDDFACACGARAIT
jgi:hypothetical protein